MRSKIIILFSLLLFTFTFAMGQKQVNSPYSRFNIGTLEPTGPFRGQGMGGIGVSMRDNSSIFYVNPASYSSLDTISFVFDFGLDYTMNRLSTGDEGYSSDDMNFDHLVIGFPLAKGFGIAAGVVPVSNGYYRMMERVVAEDPEYDPVIGPYSALHSGEGGLTNFFIGTGIKVSKNLSAGVNMTILFGQLRRSNQFSFDDLFNVYHNNSTERLQMGGINFEYGLQYLLPLKNKNFINAGISYTTGKHYNSDYENFVYRYTSFGTSDTISYTSGVGNAVLLPGTLRAGVSFGKTDKFIAGFDFVTTNWSEADIPGSSGYAADTRTLMFGAEFTPDKFSNFGFLRRMDYRIGGHTGSNYLVIGGEQVKEIGVTAGLGMPMRRTPSKTNLFVDFTRKTGAGSLHTEDYFTVGISINLYDWWFRQRKYE